MAMYRGVHFCPDETRRSRSVIDRMNGQMLIKCQRWDPLAVLKIQQRVLREMECAARFGHRIFCRSFVSDCRCQSNGDSTDDDDSKEHVDGHERAGICCLTTQAKRLGIDRKNATVFHPIPGLPARAAKEIQRPIRQFHNQLEYGPAAGLTLLISATSGRNSDSATIATMMPNANTIAGMAEARRKIIKRLNFPA